MTDLVGMTNLMQLGIINGSDLDPNELGACGDEQCGADCSNCGMANINNV